jgi:AcrR family transcriptional regulator
MMDTKNRIQEKAHELFMRYGVRSVSMDDIAGQLGMSKKTIYQYFADKDELVDAVMDEEVNQTHKDCDFCRRQSKDAVDEIFLTMEQIQEQFSQLNPMVLYDIEKFHPRAYQKFRKMKDEYLQQVVASNIKRGIKEELFRADIDVEMMSKYRVETMMISFSMAAQAPTKYNLAAVAQETMEHFLYGLATLKGYKLITKYKEDQIKKKSYDKTNKK